MSNLKTFTLQEKLSSDSLFDGELKCFQHQNGYRFSIDAVLLAHFLEVNKGDSIMDLGTGSGIISLILLYRWRQKIMKICGFEVQGSLTRLARKNIEVNGYENIGSVVSGNVVDIKELIAAETFDKVVCNPPFYPASSGRKNQNSETMVARHQVSGDLQDF